MIPLFGNRLTASRAHETTPRDWAVDLLRELNLSSLQIERIVQKLKTAVARMEKAQAELTEIEAHEISVPYADFVTTTTHKTLRGPRGGVVMCKAEHAKAVDKFIFPGMQGGPLMHVIAAKAVAFKEALSPSFTRYQQQVIANAKVLAQGLLDRGYKIVSGGTDTHLMLLNLTNKGITGKEADAAQAA